MAKKEIRRMVIEPAENGGHTVSHEYKEVQREGKYGLVSSYVEPERHVFGADEGHDMLAHVANHLNIPEADEGETEAEDVKEGAKGEHEEAKGRLTAEKAERVRKAVA